MLWIFCSLFFCGLVVRELFGAWRKDRPDPIYLPYLALITLLAIAFAWPPVSVWRFERFLEDKARLLADGKPVSVHCNTVFDTMLDPNMLAAGHANPRTGEIVVQKPWCKVLRDYLDNPEQADDEELASLNLLTHEVMHIRGELNEAVTECQSVQYNYRAARLLGVPDALAKQHARRYYTELYALRGRVGGLSGTYFSDQCGPGKALDLGLTDSTWSH
jgi:hypothetical protein